MPYIPQADRLELNEQITKVVEIISLQDDLIRRMEFAGFFTYEVVKGFMNSLNRPHSVFNSLSFDKKQKFDVSKAADKVVEHISRSGVDLLVQAGELNYVISAVGWGAMGISESLPPAKYAQRAFWKATIAYVRDKHIEGSGDIRKYLMTYGVLDDVIDEAYRRHTASYEDQKISENGDVWPLIPSDDRSSFLPEDVVVS